MYMYAHDLNYDAYYLEHHGIKGQKWGIRRFQNEDGTLTNAGRKRKGFKERAKGAGQKIKNAPVGTKAGVAGGLLAAKSIKDSLANAKAAEELMGVALAKDQVITKTLLHAGKVGAIAALAVIGGHMVYDYAKSNPDKIKKAKDWLGKSRLERAADAAQKDADDLRKNGYIKEADAVQKVADSNRKKANARKQRPFDEHLGSPMERAKKDNGRIGRAPTLEEIRKKHYSYNI